jgi:hypothetical protein
LPPDHHDFFTCPNRDYWELSKLEQCASLIAWKLILPNFAGQHTELTAADFMADRVLVSW